MALSEAEELELLELERSRHMALARTPAPVAAQEKAEPTFMQGLKAGLTAQPGKGVGHFIGSALPSTAGGAIGSIVPGPGTVLGATLVEAARQTAGAVFAPEETAKKSPLEIGAQVVGAGVGQKLGEAAGPAIAKGVSKVGEGVASLAGWLESKIGKSFLKASKSLNAYGHEPEKAIVDEGIVAYSWDDLVTKAKAAKHDLGEQIDDIINAHPKDRIVNAEDVVSPIDDALSEAAKFPNENKTLIDRLMGLKQDILDIIKTESQQGQGLDLKRANSLKRSLYKISKYSGNTSDEIPLNKTKQLVAGKLASKIEDVVPEIKPINQRYGNAVSLQNAAENRGIVAQRNDIIGMPEFFGAGLAGTGNIDLGAGVVVGNRLLKTPLGGTLGVQAASAAGKVGVQAASAAGKAAKAVTPNIASIAEQVSKRVGAPIAVETIQKGIETERADHPEIPPEYLPHLVADELKKDPNFYDKE